MDMNVNLFTGRNQVEALDLSTSLHWRSVKLNLCQTHFASRKQCGKLSRGINKWLLLSSTAHQTVKRFSNSQMNLSTSWNKMSSTKRTLSFLETSIFISMIQRILKLWTLQQHCRLWDLISTLTSHIVKGTFWIWCSPNILPKSQFWRLSKVPSSLITAASYAH